MVKNRENNHEIDWDKMVKPSNWHGTGSMACQLLLLKNLSKQSPSKKPIRLLPSQFVQIIHSCRYLLRYTRVVLICKLICFQSVDLIGWPVMLLLWNRIAGNFRKPEQWRRVLLELVVLEHIYPSVVCQWSQTLARVCTAYCDIDRQNVFHTCLHSCSVGRWGMIVFLMMSSNMTCPLHSANAETVA
jgi:hypothetical protein